jgi:hypothetical protein
MKRNPPTWYLSFGQLKVGETFRWYNVYVKEQGVTGPIMRKVSKRMYVIESYPADYTGMRGMPGRRFTTGSKTGVTTVKSNPSKRNPGSGLTHNVKPGDRVTITRRGKRVTGRVVMVFAGSHAVLNMGGRHGTPDIADDGNIVKVSKGGGRKGGFVFRNPCKRHKRKAKRSARRSHRSNPIRGTSLASIKRIVSAIKRHSRRR